MRLLVTGAAGFIGSNFVRYVLENNAETEIVILDALRYSGNRSTMADFSDKVTFVEGEIQNKQLVAATLKDYHVSHLVNFAAESHNDRSLLDNTSFVQSNTFGVQVLLELTLEHELEKMVQVSTDEVYGSIAAGEFTEQSPLEPNTPYSASKAGGDLLCRAHWKSFKCPVVVTRGGNTYGRYHFPEKLIPYFVVRLIESKKVPLYGEGTQVREWMHAHDHAAGVWTALTQGQVGEVYNVGDTNERTNIEVVELLLDELGLNKSMIKFIADPRKGAHDARYSMNTQKIRNLGWSPVMPFEESIRDTVRWYRDNENWWRPIIEKPQYRDFVTRFYGPYLGEDL